MSALPSIISGNEEQEYRESPRNKETVRFLRLSSIISLFFKLFITFCFASILNFDQSFSLKDFVNINDAKFVFYEYLIMVLGIFLVFTLFNGIINHVEQLYSYLRTFFNQSLTVIIALILPWMLSYLLLVNGKIFLNLLNW